MIDLYFWTTDNGYKARQAVEESGLEYTIKPINLREKEQFKSDFMKISPNHKIPALVDNDGPGGNTITLFESGAILKYTAEKSGNGLYPEDPLNQVNVDQWLFYGSATFTTWSQQYGHFWNRHPEDVPAAKEYYKYLFLDMLGTVDKALADRDYVAGEFSVADIAIYADVEFQAVEDFGLDDFLNLKRWYEDIHARPATQRAWGPFE
jgi:GST-like protein